MQISLLVLVLLPPASFPSLPRQIFWMIILHEAMVSYSVSVCLSGELVCGKTVGESSSTLLPYVMRTLLLP